MFHSDPVKEEFSQSTYQMLSYWKLGGSKSKSIRLEALVEEVHEIHHKTKKDKKSIPHIS